MISFADYLNHHAKARRNPVGDFIRDARKDWEWPKDISSMRQLRGYLWTQSACPECIQAAAICWQNYKIWLKTKKD